MMRSSISFTRVSKRESLIVLIDVGGCLCTKVEAKLRKEVVRHVTASASKFP